MFHNWVEMRVYMIDRQEDLLCDAQAARQGSLSRRVRREQRKKQRAEQDVPLVRPDIQEGGACC